MNGIIQLGYGSSETIVQQNWRLGDFDIFRQSVLCYVFNMNSRDVIAILRRHESDLRARGIRHAAIFGSVARGENYPDSDIDIMIDIDPEAHITIFDYVGLKDYVSSLFTSPVDVVDRDALKPHLRAPAARDALYAF